MSLPGVNTVIKDRFYSLSRTDIPVGPRVLVIAKRSTANGTGGVADLDPYNLAREDTAISTFGDGSQVHRAFLELVAGGAQQITIVALPSDTTYNHTNGTIASSTYTTANPSGDLWNDAWSAAEAANPDVIVPWGRGSNSLDWESPATPGNETELGFHANNSATVGNSWARKVADKAAQITNESNPCLAILGVKPFIGATADGLGGMTPADVASHLALSSNLTTRSLIGDTGIYLSIVATELKPLGYPTEYGYANGACAYAGHIAQLDSWSSPTGKAIVNVEQLRYNPTRSQQQILVDKAIVPVAVDYNRVPTWVDAMTYSKDTSDYTRLTTLRIIFDAVQMVRQVAQKFVGEGSTLALRNALETAITAGLRGMQQEGALLASDFEVTYAPRESKAIVDLVLTPAFELRNIEVRVSVNL